MSKLNELNHEQRCLEEFISRSTVIETKHSDKEQGIYLTFFNGTDIYWLKKKELERESKHMHDMLKVQLFKNGYEFSESFESLSTTSEYKDSQKLLELLGEDSESSYAAFLSLLEEKVVYNNVALYFLLKDWREKGINVELVLQSVSLESKDGLYAQYIARTIELSKQIML